MRHADVLLMVGTDFPYRDWLPDDATVIQIDNAPERVGRRVAVQHGLIGDAGPTLRALAEQVKPRVDTSHLDKTNRIRRLWEVLLTHQASPRRHGPMHPQYVVDVVSRLAADDAVFCVDTGEVTVWAARHLRMRGTQRFLLSFNLASMAFAMPAAMGAQLLDPERPVIALSGDGGLTMLLGDLISLVAHDLPVTIIVFNNSKLGLVKMEMEAAGFPEYGVDLANPDLAAVARAIGLHAVRVERPDELESAISDALAHPGPSLVDAVVSADEITIPPSIAPAQAWGFSLAKIREIFADDGETGAG